MDAKVATGEDPPGVLTLTEMESTSMMVGPAITTVTFMSGDAMAAAKQLRTRFTEVLQANPWLTGRIKKDKASKRVQLHHPVEVKLGDVASMFYGPEEKQLPAISSTMAFYDLCSTLSGSVCEVPTGQDCMSKSTPLVTLSIVADHHMPKKRFAVVWSVSHVIVDGFTYYKLLAMLSSAGVVAPLNAARKHSIKEESERAAGLPESAFLKSNCVICNVVCTMLCSSTKPDIRSYYVDAARVNEAKGKAELTEKVAFVSTNDILSSTFARATDCQVLLVPINFRQKLPAYTENDAGNYESALCFTRDDCVTPTLVRGTLNSGPPAYSRATTVGLPGGCSTFSTRLSMVTSWVFPWYSELKIRDCEQILHMPHCDVKMVPFNITVVYRPRAGQLAVAIFSRKVPADVLVAQMPLGSPVINADQAAKTPLG
jgi:hypothetical protein